MRRWFSRQRVANTLLVGAVLGFAAICWLMLTAPSGALDRFDPKLETECNAVVAGSGYRESRYAEVRREGYEVCETLRDRRLGLAVLLTVPTAVAATGGLLLRR